MLKKIFDHKLRFFIGGILVFLLVLIRAFERVLFYDPFLQYFELNFNELPLPDYNSFQLFIGLLFRYVLNAVISLALIYVIFKDKGMVKFASVLYVFCFVFLIVGFFGAIQLYGNHNNFILFYIRRFLIQPLFVMLFIPAFYYQRLSK
ncbi:exosortase F system-associated protein [Flavobacterium ovatum]|uniref:exosortase F system-associated membrane protein n=1 Tax=Flavobacterium ovatum TaxID=1928857 RepID=UPI00344BE96A